MKPKQTEDVRVRNDGLHSKRRLNTIQQVFRTHDLKNAVLFHVILSGSQEKPVYQATMKALMRHIRTKCRAEYMNAYEVGAEKNGLHCHMFIIIETVEHFPSDLLDVREGGWIARRVKRKAKEAKEAGLDKTLSIRIEPPKNTMHGGAMFARMNTPAKLENCINWCTYQLKPRSKEGVPGRETYSGSEFVSNIAKREEKRQKYRDALTKSSKPAPISQINEGTNEDRTTTQSEANSTEACSPIGLPADPERISTEGMVDARQSASASEEVQRQQEARPRPHDQRNGNGRATTYYEGTEMTLTAAQKYLAGLYEQAIDLGLDMDEMRRYFLDRGVKRTPLQLEDELQNACGFYAYAASHPPKPAIGIREWDRIADRVSPVSSRQLSKDVAPQT